jgi:hypothetical protein
MGTEQAAGRGTVMTVRLPRGTDAASAHGLVDFTIEGVVEGRAVCAHWSHGRLRCDERLRARALVLVDLGEELIYTDPPRRFAATLEGRPVAIALTLLRACDRVTAFQIDLDQPGEP